MDTRNSQGDLPINNTSSRASKKHRRILGGQLMKRSASRIPSLSERESKMSGNKQIRGSELNKMDSVLSLVGNLPELNVRIRSAKGSQINPENSLSSFSLLSHD